MFIVLTLIHKLIYVTCTSCMSTTCIIFFIICPLQIILFLFFLLQMLAVHAKSIVAILHLLVALSQHFRAPIRLPDHVSIQVVVVQVGETVYFNLHA